MTSQANLSSFENRFQECRGSNRNNNFYTYKNSC